MEIIGQQIKKYRLKNSLTQEQLGNLVGVTTQAVSKWERGSTPDAETLPRIAETLSVSIDTLFGIEEQDIRILLTKKLSKLPVSEAFRYAFDICWSLIFGLTGDAEFTDDFGDTLMGQPDLRKEKSHDYYAKLIRDDGMALARLSNQFSQFYLFAESENDNATIGAESMEKIRKVFALLSEENLLKTICYLYSMPAVFITAPLISKGTGLDMPEVERCMKIICDLQLAVSMKIAAVDGEIDSYSIRKECCAVPLLLFADEIAKGSPNPIFRMIDREKPLLSTDG